MTAILAAAAVAVSSTSYCLGGTMADGTPTRPGSAAHNGLALGTRIWVEPAALGRHRWTVRDRIGWGTELDLWTGSCGAALDYGRRAVRLSVGWPRLRARRHARPLRRPDVVAHAAALARRFRRLQRGALGGP